MAKDRRQALSAVAVQLLWRVMQQIFKNIVPPTKKWDKKKLSENIYNCLSKSSHKQQFAKYTAATPNGHTGTFKCVISLPLLHWDRILDNTVALHWRQLEALRQKTSSSTWNMRFEVCWIVSYCFRWLLTEWNDLVVSIGEMIGDSVVPLLSPSAWKHWNILCKWKK